MALGIVPKYNLHHVIQGKKKISDIIMKIYEGVKIIPAASGIEELANLSSFQREEIIFQLNSLKEEADILLIDTPAGISNNTIDFLLASQEIIVISTSEPTAITDAYAMIKIISKKNRDIKIWIMINMANSEKEAKEIARGIILTSKRFLNVSVQSLGFLLKDRCIPEAVRKQSSFNILYPYSQASRTTTLLAKRLYA